MSRSRLMFLLFHDTPRRALHGNRPRLEKSFIARFLGFVHELTIQRKSTNLSFFWRSLFLPTGTNSKQSPPKLCSVLITLLWSLKRLAHCSTAWALVPSLTFKGSNSFIHIQESMKISPTYILKKTFQVSNATAECELQSHNGFNVLH